jgi:site-specific recombinase XerD
MKATFTPIFNRKDKLNKHGLAPIEIRMYQNRQRRHISTGISISPIQWDEKRQEINKKHKDFELLNYQISDMITKFETSQVEHTVKGKSFTINSLGSKKTIEYNGSFVAFVREEIKNDRLLTASTKASHTNTLNKLIEFKGNENIKFDDINYIFLDNFLNHLRKNKLAINTVHKQHKNLKKFIEIAIKKEFIEGINPCKELKVKTEQKKREVLTFDEIEKVSNLDLSGFDDKLSIIRDIFLFSCYTGLRISDATTIKTADIKKGKLGYELDIVTQKTNKRAELPLYSLFKKPKSVNSLPELIIKKYFEKNNEFLFPKLTDQFINRNLKVIAFEAKLPFKVTFHTARHSFGTYMASKIPLPQLSYLMQHSDIKTTMLYVNMNQELVKQGLIKVEWN